MHPPLAVVDRFANVYDYLRSSEFKTNTKPKPKPKPKPNIFSPLRKVNSEPAEKNVLPLNQDLKFEIVKYLNLKDFISFSAINVDNFISLRSDNYRTTIWYQKS